MSVIINGTGGGGTPANPNGSVQFNNGGNFGGFGVWTPGTDTLELPAVDSATPVTMNIQFQSVLGGTLNTAGATTNINGSLSTGGANQGNISFNTGFFGLSNAGPLTCTISIAAPAVITANANGFPMNCPVYFTTTGSLPTGLTPLTTYYVDPFSFPGLQPNQFEVAATNGGSTINTTGTQSGVHTVTAGGAVTISIGSPAVITLNFHCLVPGQTITFQTTGALPTGISVGVTYFVIYAGLTRNMFEISTTLNGAAVNTSGVQSGTQTIQIQGGTVQNPAEPSVVIGTPAATLQGSLANAPNPLTALTLNMVNAASAAQPPTVFAVNMWGISPYETVLFDFFDVPNGVARYFMNFTPPGPVIATGDYSVAITGLSGESTRTGIFLNTDSNARLLFGLSVSDVPNFALGNGSLVLDTFLSRAAAGVYEFGTAAGNALGWFNYGGQTRAASDFPVTSSAVLVNVTGLSVNVQAGRSYAFDVYLTCTDAGAGGVQAAIGGSCSATAIEYDGWAIDNNLIKGQANSTALGGAVASTITTFTAGVVIIIKGLITVNAAGTLTVQFAQNTPNVTASTVKRGSWFMVQDLQ